MELSRRAGVLFATRFELDADVSASELEVVCSVWAELHRTWTSFDDQSPLRRLNRSDGKWVEVEPLLLWAARSCVAATEATNGLFNPLVDLAAIEYTNTWPSAADSEAFVILDQCLETRGGEVRLPKGLSLDLGGVAQAMAADWAISYLKESGADVACADIGGAVAVLGERQVAVEHANGNVWWNWKVTGGGVCTSSTQSPEQVGKRCRASYLTELSFNSVFSTVSSHAGSAFAAEVANWTVRASGSLERARDITGAVVVAGCENGIQVEQTSTARLYGSPAMRSSQWNLAERVER